MPINSQIKDFIDITHGFVGMKQGSEFLTGKKAKVQLYEIYEHQSVLEEECRLKEYQFMGYCQRWWYWCCYN
jgi:hypothetical protein